MNFLYAAKLLEHIRSVLEGEPTPLEQAETDRDPSRATTDRSAERDDIKPPKPKGTVGKLPYTGVNLTPIPKDKLDNYYLPRAVPVADKEPDTGLQPSNAISRPVGTTPPSSSTLDVRDSELINSPAPIRNPAWSQKAQQFAAQSSSYTAVTRDPAKSSKLKR